MHSLELGEALPDWKIEPIFGDDLPAVSDFAGKPLVILIFSFGCPGCLGRAIPFANSLKYELGDSINVVGIHTNIEGFDKTNEEFAKAREEFYFRFPFFRDANNISTYLAYKAGGTPHWVLADKQGNIAYSIFGSDPNNALLRLRYRIDELIGE